MHALSLRIQEQFKLHQNPDQAKGMKAYMKNQFPFLGIKTPERRQILKGITRQVSVKSFDELKTVVEELWLMEEREYQYAAMDLLIAHKKLWNSQLPDLVENLVQKKYWWDTVDCLASSVFGAYLLRSKTKEEKRIAAWIESSNLWLNRTAIIFQLSFREKTNLNTLESAIMPHLNSNEFFHQKAIGWSLRSLARYNPDWVLDFCKNYTLKPLSRKEALKHLKP
jgi:3-methyladenine DNA glycosylase AlkD